MAMAAGNDTEEFRGEFIADSEEEAPASSPAKDFFATHKTKMALGVIAVVVSAALIWRQMWEKTKEDLQREKRIRDEKLGQKIREEELAKRETEAKLTKKIEDQELAQKIRDEENLVQRRNQLATYWQERNVPMVGPWLSLLINSSRMERLGPYEFQEQGAKKISWLITDGIITSYVWEKNTLYLDQSYRITTEQLQQLKTLPISEP
jgi:hypothetical protein